MRLASIYWLFLGLVLIGLAILRQRTHRKTAIQFSNTQLLSRLKHQRTQWISKLVTMLRYIILILIVITLARPQDILLQRESQTEGVDIMMVLDVSGSMAAEDFKPDNRLEVAKNTILSFIKKRESDRIGLVVFGGDSYVQCPPTLDYRALSQLLSSVTLNMAGEGTAIGMAISTGLSRLSRSHSKSKVMVLLTDGENTRGAITPERAARMAQQLGVRIYTIGVGRKGGVDIMLPTGQVQHMDVDEDSLIEIASITNGQFFRAHNEKDLIEIYEKIDRLEKSTINRHKIQEYKEFFPWLLGLILSLIILELVLANLFLVVVP
ncbi:MAG: aerotolerance regulator BatA [Actinobacteria bacterium]|nr:aerotolerance regulator BatA [Actinomycetota bacterium]